ncbi:hypothetical protein G6F55_009723 [Rhizopus delemar]|uniref:NADP-dependent oxidoreductase domain-containing protein n=1 Tax=Rhizopus delemar TaxID=936053 RepID=A0A9P7CMI7_9FUNG|nr:hypothetical protein G6F55_009723 [Rhizopus delemar]KAG1491275.1 hypothetical protein G6F54_010139 [Rhizopus delemar]KAG1567191.1 hypothetical protein G6F50_008439 [Rhizopus delemar]KAG1639379.1 hypothetical protein G6F44_007895 [Rhizopus delemar]
MSSGIDTLPKMEYVRLGNTGMKVSRFCVGCMSYGSSKWMPWVKDEEESINLIGKAYECGINFFDTANVYSNGESERVLGKAIKKFNMPRSRIVIATKVFFIVNEKDAPRSINIQGVEEALNDVVRSGKVRYIGASSMSAWQFQKANAIANKNGWAKFVSMQNMYNLIHREEEREMIPYCVDSGIASIHWPPLAKGLLIGKNRDTVRKNTDIIAPQLFGDILNANDDAIIDRILEIAEKYNRLPAQCNQSSMHLTNYDMI